MKAKLSIALIVVGLSVSGLASASKYSEINVRTHVDNASLNKIAGARLQGMLAGSDRSPGPSTGSRDCVTQIGNQDANQSLIGSQQDVIVIGDIINFCQ